MNRTRVGAAALVITLCVAPRLSSQPASDEQIVTQMVDRFRDLVARTDFGEKIERSLADDYVHITPDGTMTTSWRYLRNPTAKLSTEKLHVRVFGDLAIASYLWRLDGGTSRIAQVFQKRPAGWRIIATQIGGRNPGFTGPLASNELITPRNNVQSEKELRETWQRYVAALDRRTPAGGRAEDMDTARSIVAEECLFVLPNGDAVTRDERFRIGHPDTVQLTGKQVTETVAGNSLQFVDDQLAVFGNAAVWTSRNVDNGMQNVVVWLKRPQGWQQLGILQGLSWK